MAIVGSLDRATEGTHVMAVLPVAAKLNIIEVARAIGKKKVTLVSPGAATALTGTTSKHREGFKTMIADALVGKIDLHFKACPLTTTQGH